jgi:hypothetical protein
MAFCTSCGAEVSGAAVCLECGAGQGAAAPQDSEAAENNDRLRGVRHFPRDHRSIPLREWAPQRTGYHFLGRRFAGSWNAGSDL